MTSSKQNEIGINSMAPGDERPGSRVVYLWICEVVGRIKYTNDGLFGLLPGVYRANSYQDRVSSLPKVELQLQTNVTSKRVIFEVLFYFSLGLGKYLEVETEKSERISAGK